MRAHQSRIGARRASISTKTVDILIIRPRRSRLEHELRHSYASRALALGESLSAIGKLLGHRHVVSMARYAHLMRDAEKRAASRVCERIGFHVTEREG